MFIGEYEHTVDAKGRVIMPVKLREEIGEKFIVTKGQEGCLFAYSNDEWKNFEEKLKTLPSYTNKTVRDFIRYFLSGAVECELDKQGRFLIPANLRKHSMLEKDVVIIGVGTKIEIWDKTMWKRYSNDDNISSEDFAENLSNLGI